MVGVAVVDTWIPAMVMVTLLHLDCEQHIRETKSQRKEKKNKDKQQGTEAFEKSATGRAV